MAYKPDGRRKPVIVSHMINPLCLIGATDSRRLFLAVFVGGENDFDQPENRFVVLETDETFTGS
jgi:hypothetical protein